MGNHLIVNDVVYDKFMELLGDEEEPSVIYTKWMEIADNISLKQAKKMYEKAAEQGYGPAVEKLKQMNQSG